MREPNKKCLIISSSTDFENNKGRFDVKKACLNLKIPTLFIHGSNDESVNIDYSENLNLWTKNSQFRIIENANHTFGAKEPWENGSLPKELDEAVEACIDFFKKK
ncbi:alpha/beta hydrolase family protein [Epilithonimonas sp. UC225_85]|uniref:alpha/beta hydrolase family protein n=1 Tax=Epilithonimonas sp. UC225_85 TaxID=3350167 RepID=UPI0036D28A69